MIYNFCINDFEGPLDLLLHLIRSSQMDIYEINVESITSQYLDFINKSKELTVDIASEYLVMAAELVHLKSRLLLNKKEEDEEDSEFEINTEEDLRNRLLEYERVKSITDQFKQLEEKRSEFYTKLPTNLNEFRGEDVPLTGDQTVDDLIEAFQLFLNRQELAKPLNTKITKKEFSVTERKSEIRNLLRTKKKCTFFDLFDVPDKPYVVVTFLSVLDMAKNDEIMITQEHNFGNILLEMK